MYVYDIGYGTYEESQYTQLLSEKKYTRQELHELIYSIIRKLIVNIDAKVLKMDDGEEFVHSKPGYVDKGFNDDDTYNLFYHLSFQDVYSDVIKELIKNHGFKELTFESNYSIMGWANLLEAGHWKDDVTEESQDITNRLKGDAEVQKKISSMIDMSRPIIQKEMKKVFTDRDMKEKK